MGLTVLIVDDDRAVRQGLRRDLAALGASVIEVGVREAPTAISEVPTIDVIVSAAPGLARCGRRPPAIFLARATPPGASSTLDAGDRLIARPYAIDDLVDVVIEATAAPRTRPRLIVIESNPAARAAMCEGLAEMGFDVAGTADRAGAAERVAHERIDLAIVEHAPPWTDGARLVARLREPRPELRAVLVSEAPLDELPAIAQCRGLAKPTSLDALADAIGAVLALADA